MGLTLGNGAGIGFRQRAVVNPPLPNYISSTYNLSGSLAYTVINKTIGSTGDFVEIKAKALSTNTTTDLTYLAAPNVSFNRFAFFSDTQMQLRITGVTTVYWTIGEMVKTDYNIYKLVKVATGYELFINGVSLGVQVTAGVFNCYSIGANVANSGVGKWEIEYVKTSVSGVETSYTDLFDNGGSTNVIRTEYDLAALSQMYIIKQLNPVANVTERLNVYLKFKDSKYQHYFIDHEVNGAIYTDNWRLTKSVLADWNFISSSFIDSVRYTVQVGENELALDQGSFVGGYHGHERIDLEGGNGVVFYVDGVLKTLGDFSTSTFTTGTTFKYSQTSTVYNPTVNDILLSHIKETTVSGKGYITDNVFTLATDHSLTAYYGIVCVGKDVAKYVSNETLSYQLFTSDNQNHFVTTNPPLREMHSYNDLTRIRAFVTSKLFDLTDDALGTHEIVDRANDSKYYRITANDTYLSGKTFHSETKVEFTTY